MTAIIAYAILLITFLLTLLWQIRLTNQKTHAIQKTTEFSELADLFFLSFRAEEIKRQLHHKKMSIEILCPMAESIITYLQTTNRSLSLPADWKTILYKRMQEVEEAYPIQQPSPFELYPQRVYLSNSKAMLN
jgi:hypothetical protein